MPKVKKESPDTGQVPLSDQMRSAYLEFQLYLKTNVLKSNITQLSIIIEIIQFYHDHVRSGDKWSRMEKSV